MMGVEMCWVVGCDQPSQDVVLGGGFVLGSSFFCLFFFAFVVVGPWFE